MRAPPAIVPDAPPAGDPQWQAERLLCTLEAVFGPATAVAAEGEEVVLTFARATVRVPADPQATCEELVRLYRDALRGAA